MTTILDGVKCSLKHQATSRQQRQKWIPKKLTEEEPQTSSKPNSINKKKWVPKQYSVTTNLESKMVESYEAVPQPIDPSQFFMTINPIFDPSPSSDVDQVVDDILCHWDLY